MDVFISHAYEDKDDIARPLAVALRAHGVSVWFDEYVLTIGDNLRETIDDGLKSAQYGVVILSPAFFSKEWPRRELDALWARETADGVKVILPVLHNLDYTEAARYSPLLSSKVAVSSARGVDFLAGQIAAVVKRLPLTTVETSSNSGRPQSTTEIVNATLARAKAGLKNTFTPAPGTIAGCSTLARAYGLMLVASAVVLCSGISLHIWLGVSTISRQMKYSLTYRPSWLSETLLGFGSFVLVTGVAVFVVWRAAVRRGWLAATYASAVAAAGAFVALMLLTCWIHPNSPMAESKHVLLVTIISAALSAALACGCVAVVARQLK